MAVKIITGNIFTSTKKVIVNTINCVGVMGAGIALECRLRYPEMFDQYVKYCNQGVFKPGVLWLYKTESRWILNFPTKVDWKHPSKESYLRTGLQKFVETYHERKIDSIAFPLLGADKGGIDKKVSLSIMQEYLNPLPIDIEIYNYDPTAYDDIFEDLKKWLLSTDLTQLSQVSTIRKNHLEKVIEAIQQNNITQVNQLAQVKGIGIVTLEKLFAYRKSGKAQIKQTELF